MIDKFFLKFGELMAALFLKAAIININSTCKHYFYQDSIPKSAEKFRRTI